jgi:Domain of unknown function (DUF4157)
VRQYAPRVVLPDHGVETLKYDDARRGRHPQRPTHRDEPAPKPRVAPGKQTLTQGLQQGPNPRRGPAPQVCTPEERATYEAERRQRNAEIDRTMDFAMRPDLFPELPAHDAGEDSSSTPESTAEPQAAAPARVADTRELAAAGVAGTGGTLPHLDRLQHSFGHHDVIDVQAHVGGPAAEASQAMGAAAYATGDRVAFASAPDLHTAAHEVAHVVQQRAGVSLPGGVGQAGDAYEQHADAVADHVVRGESAADLLDQADTPSGAAPAAPAVQRRSLPGSAPAAPSGATPAAASPGPAAQSSAQDGSAAAGADDQAAIDAAEQAALADEVETLLSRPDPVAGIGTPQDALRVLAALPMGERLATLDILEQRGRLSEIVPFVDSGNADPAGRIRTALLARELASMTLSEAMGTSLETLAAAVEHMPADEQYGVYRYLTSRRQPSLDLEMLLEGALAMQSALVAQSETVPGAPGAPGATGATGAMAGTAMPAPIEPLPWTLPGRQPAPLYRGNAAHKAIAAHYRTTHEGDTIWTNFTSLRTILAELSAQGHPVDSSRLTRQELDSKPDILNATRRGLYELKPKGAAGSGQLQASLYIGALGKAGYAVSLGPSNDPGTSGQLPAPGGVFIFRSVVPGVIEYEYREGRLVPVPIPVTRDVRQESPESSWTWELQPLTPAQQSALATATLGTALLVLAMILLAPVGI